METTPIKFGTRKLQKGTRGYTVNIPLILIKSFGLKAHDELSVSTMNGDIIFRRVDEA